MALATREGARTLEYHTGFAFKVTIGDVPDGVGDGSGDGWSGHLAEVVRALVADQQRLDIYIAHRCAWELMLEEGAEGAGLCGVLGVPRDSSELFPFLLGLRVTPNTRLFLKDLKARDRHEDDTPNFFTEEIERVIVVEADGVWHHRAA